MTECNGDDLRNLAPIIWTKYNQLRILENEIEKLNRSAFPRGADAVFVDRSGERTPVKIGDRIKTDIFVSDKTGRNFCACGDRLILFDKIPGEI